MALSRVEPLWKWQRTTDLTTKTPEDPTPKWLQWSRELRSLGQAGLTYTENLFDRERYERLIDIAAEIVAEHEEVEKSKVLALFTKQTGYATPKVSVRGAIVRDGKILLVQERTDGLWALPGGWADVGEGPRSVLEREVWEEANIRVRTNKLVGLYDVNRSGRPLELFHAYKLVFLCTQLDDSLPRPGTEALSANFFSLAELPPLSRNRTSKRELDDIFIHLDKPELPTHVDF